MTGGLETARVRPLMHPARSLIFILQEVKETLGSPWLLLTNKRLTGYHVNGWAGGWALVQNSAQRPQSPVKPLQITGWPRWPADLKKQEAQRHTVEQKRTHSLPTPSPKEACHMQCGPTRKAFSGLAAWLEAGLRVIYISPYVAHSWVQTGTGANMQKRQYLHSSGLPGKLPGGAGLVQSQQTKEGCGGGGSRAWMPGGVRLAGKSQAGQRPMEWQEKAVFIKP